MMGSRKLHSFLLAAAVLGVPALAHADPTPTDKETARGFMSEGRGLREKNDEAAALQRFEAADAIMHVPTTGFEVARSQVALGHLVDARETARRVIRLPVDGNEPAPFTEARAKAQALDQQLESRIPTLKISLKSADAAGAKVTIDGREVPAAALGSSYRTDPGHHVIVATAGDREARQEVDLAEGARREVSLELRAPVVAKQEPSPGSPPDEELPSTGHASVGPLVYIGFGFAAAGAVTGTVAGLIALSAKNSAEQGCFAGKCPTPTHADLDRAQTFATVSTVAVAVGVVGAGVAIIDWALTPSSKPPSTTTGLRVRPWVGVGSAGLSGKF